ncbi:hypothetical protein GCM10020000_15050 [Streptomyces olivoverticillatus]
MNTGRGDTHGNPAPVVDRRTGRIVLATTYNKGRADAGNCDVPCNRTPHLQYSDDDGVSWSRPRELTASIRLASWNSWYATGSGHGIQLAHGRHRGRLVIGVNAESHNGTRTSANHAALALSDDGGAHWRLGATDTFRVAADSTYRQKPSELTLAERDDGTVYVNGREQGGTDLGNRDEAVSGNGGAGFTAPFRSLPGLYSPMVQGAVLPLRSGRWLFSAPADPDRRRTMTIRSSYDEGRTWEGAERGRQVTADWSGYSDMTLVGTGTVGLLYEAGKSGRPAGDPLRPLHGGVAGPPAGPGPDHPRPLGGRPGCADTGRRPAGGGPVRAGPRLRRQGSGRPPALPPLPAAADPGLHGGAVVPPPGRQGRAAVAVDGRGRRLTAGGAVRGAGDGPDRRAAHGRCGRRAGAHGDGPGGRCVRRRAVAPAGVAPHGRPADARRRRGRRHRGGCPGHGEPHLDVRGAPRAEAGRPGVSDGRSG